MSLTQEEAHVVPTSRLLKYLKSIFLKQISPFALNFEHCNVADVVYAQTTLTHIRKVKS